jgi:serine/threonine-protein kinase ATR
MATFQTMLAIPELAEVTLDSWHIFLSSLAFKDIGSHVGPTSASFISAWPSLSPRGRETAKRSLDYIVFKAGAEIGKNLDEVADLSTIPELHKAHERLKALRSGWSPKDKLQHLLERSISDNLTVAVQSLRELKIFMLMEHKSFIRDLASGDIFDPLVGQILAALFAAACRDGDAAEGLRLLSFECIGILGAVDPDRCEIGLNDTRTVVLHNFTDEGESVLFALHLIRDLLVGAFRSTSDIKHQSHLAYSIQELLRFCKFTPALVTSGTNNATVTLKVRNRWDSLPKHVLETVTPLLEARFTLNLRPMPELQHPIYSNQSTYREWIQLWTSYLITKASGDVAQTIFWVFRSAVRNKDVGVAHHLLPHLVLNILISGNEADSNNIRAEILVVLEDQVDADSKSTADKKLLSAQVSRVLARSR